MLVRILEDYGSAEHYNVGDVVDVTNPATLVAEGKVEYVTDTPVTPVAPVTPAKREEKELATIETEITDVRTKLGKGGDRK